MNAEEDKLTPSTWIPWIVAMAVVFGWGTFAPDHLGARREKSPDGIGMVHQTDELPAPGITPHPLTGLLPDVFGGHFWSAPTVILSIEVLREIPTIGFRREGIQGRAPPSLA
ncbi:hypothetical protein OKA05_26485 [Luteolibacter arcticus]|uniref:Uncharacterized protein n=1 Tax=Luteolibacter arcticus TaxID=1581411 RepID=A0ABT3GRH2_9BACT|nr:hypothetical protein [Luteolibacter arcticus]MCW1926134.1 hypothetical protein [Luteolibacter arcticus]